MPSSPSASSRSTVPYNWGNRGPGNGIGTNNFSVRWTGLFNFSPGNYTFTARINDGVRVWLDNVLIINRWQDRSAAATFTSTRAVTTGQHTVRVEYYENTGQALIQVSW